MSFVPYSMRPSRGDGFQFQIIGWISVVDMRVCITVRLREQIVGSSLLSFSMYTYSITVVNKRERETDRQTDRDRDRETETETETDR